MADEQQNQNAASPSQPTADCPDTAQGSGYFQEANGTNSSMRLMCFISLLASILFGALTIYLGTTAHPSSDGIIITFGFLVGAFAPKAVQKFAEEKIGAKA